MLRAEFSGRHFRVQLDGKIDIEVDDGHIDTDRADGVWTKADSVTVRSGVNRETFIWEMRRSRRLRVGRCTCRQGLAGRRFIPPMLRAAFDRAQRRSVAVFNRHRTAS